MKTLVFLSIILLLITVGVIFFIFLDGQFPQTTAWQEYRNTELGFSLTYPESMEVQSPDPFTVVFLLDGPTQELDDAQFQDGISFAVSKKRFWGRTGNILEEYVEGSAAETEEVTVLQEPRPIEINGHQSYTYTLQGVENIPYTVYAILVKPGEVMEITTVVLDPSNQGFEQIKNDMLTSFTFSP